MNPNIFNDIWGQPYAGDLNRSLPSEIEDKTQSPFCPPFSCFFANKFIWRWLFPKMVLNKTASEEAESSSCHVTHPNFYGTKTGSQWVWSSVIVMGDQYRSNISISWYTKPKEAPTSLLGPHKREKSSFISSQNYPWFTLTFQQNQAAVFNQMQDWHGLIELVQLSLKIKIMIVDF